MGAKTLLVAALFVFSCVCPSFCRPGVLQLPSESLDAAIDSWRQKPKDLFSSKAKPVNFHPLIGILSQPGDGDGGLAPRLTKPHGNDDEGNVSYIAASYVKWVESAGARPVHILYNETKESMAKKFSLINGLLIPGGNTDLVPGPFMDAAAYLLQLALQANDAGDYFPVQGTCMGMETLVVLVSKDFNILQLGQFKSGDLPSSIKFAGEWAKKRSYFSWFTPSLLEKIQTRNITIENHESGTTVGRFLSNANLRAFFNILATSFDRTGKEYVANIEAKKYPVYATQWHPEKTAFEWGLPNIPHNADAISVCQTAAGFFVNEARKSSHKPSSVEELDELLIYNYSPIFSGKNGKGFFEQSYVFE